MASPSDQVRETDGSAQPEAGNVTLLNLDLHRHLQLKDQAKVLESGEFVEGA